MTATTRTTAADQGRRLALQLLDQLKQLTTGSVLRYATVRSATVTDGVWLMDIDLDGTTWHGVPITMDCVGARAGDRCIVEIQDHLPTVTGIIARAATDPVLMEWSSTWSGIPGYADGKVYTETTRNLVHGGGPLLCEVAAAVSGSGEYGMAVDFTDSAGKTIAHWGATSPQKNGGTLRWVQTGTISVPPGEYTVALTTSHWGTVSIVGGDSSGNSRKWRDSAWSADGVPRYARITRL